jgi:hypothetical protein
MVDQSIRVASKALILDSGEILLAWNLHPDDPTGSSICCPVAGRTTGSRWTSVCAACEETGYAIEVGRCHG